jgi:hypothetical protein
VAHAARGRKKKPLIEPRKPEAKKRENRRRKKSSQRECRKKINPEEDGISNRQNSSAFIPPTT